MADTSLKKRRGRPSKYATDEVRLQAQREKTWVRVQALRQRQKSEKEMDIHDDGNANRKKDKVLLDNTWQAEKTSVVNETQYRITRSSLQQPIMSPPLLSSSLSLPTLPTSSVFPSPSPHRPYYQTPSPTFPPPTEQDEDNIQKTIDDFSTIRLYSTSPIKQPEPITHLLQCIQPTRQQFTPTYEDGDWRYMGNKDDEDEKEEEIEEGGYGSETIYVRPKLAQRMQVEIPIKKKRRDRKEKGKEKERDKMTLVQDAAEWLESQLTKTFGCRSHDEEDEEDTMDLKGLVEYWKEQGVPDVLEDDGLLTKEGATQLEVDWKAALSDSNPP
ncbi:MAG: hypothetical protein M1840_006386 [Geoglossum simile]|nr:MAG: hypothetical protein M1840_006386 [Geoglossum simile]